MHGGQLSNKSLAALKGRDIRCLLFDFGDTLWTRRDPETWKQLEITANQYAVRLLREHISSQLLPNLDDITLGHHLRTSLETYVRNLVQRNPGREANGPLAVVQVLRQWGLAEVDFDFGAAIFEALRIRIPASRSLFTDALSTLAAFQQRGFLLGVVTNRLWGGKPFQEDLLMLDLLNYFEPRHIAISADLGVRKPHAIIFLHVLSALNVRPEQAVMVGDSLRADIVGGLNLGMFCIWKPQAQVRAQIPAHLLAPGASAPVFTEGDAYRTKPGQVIQAAPGVLTADPTADDVARASSGIRVTDDDIVLAGAQQRDSYVEPFIHGEIRPHLVIEHLSDLLDVFLKVGVQL